jgi:uncharacterized hydrophobic protein (TIGR00271 family)
MENNSNNREVKLPDLNVLWEGVKKYITDVVRLDRGVDKNATIAEIKNKKSMNEANAWMLMCSIVIASIGLSQNSQAVIIGAMLISPLMSPILGVGLGVAINDHDTLFKSLQHLGLAILITLVTSTIYFAVTPFGGITDEISARTEPTFLDIFIAIFGGIAGIVSIARKDISTTLPGVAIATALMPPLCVTGYGIANGEWNVAATSFYLFFLNTFFVALSTYFIIKFLKFPLRKYINPEDRRRNLIAVIVVILAAVIPSFLIFRDVLDDLRLNSRLDQFVNECIGPDKDYWDDYIIEERGTSKLLILKVYGTTINDSKIPEYTAELEKLNVHNTQIRIIPSTEVELEDIASLENKLLSLEQITERLDESKKVRIEQETMIQQLSEKINSGIIDSSLFVEIASELKTIFPGLNEVGMAKIQTTDFDLYQKELPVTLVEWDQSVSRAKRSESEKRMQDFLIERLDLDSLVLIRY